MLCLPALRRNALLVAAALAAMSAAHAAPEGGQVVAGQAGISRAGSTTRIDQSSQRAIIDWRSYSVGAGERVQYVQPNAQAATLNRVTGDQISVILGRIDANGQVILINPNGVSIGSGAQLNVGSLIMSTAGISNADFLTGKLAFNQAGKANAAIVNAGSITAAEGGLVALVAPHVRNDGLIQARLGKVALGAGDTFTIDLYGDALLNLAVSDAQAKTLTHTGSIAADGGTVVLATPMQAKGVLDNLINLSGAIRADSVGQQGGKIVLMARGGTAEVNGTMQARGNLAGERGGHITATGDKVLLGATARLDASGAAGGGSVHVGGGYQGQGDTPRAQHTSVAAGARIDASATQQGNGGEAVVWADGATEFAGAIAARGGAAGGNGGRLEVSGKHTLDYQGHADASAPQGKSGSLLLDPEYAVIGAAQANAINATLRTGTGVTVTSASNIDVNAQIDGRSGAPGGAITLTAAGGINVNDFIVTDAGAITLTANGGAINVGVGKGLFVMSGLGNTPASAPITLNATGDITLRTLVTAGTVSATSSGGSIVVNERPDSSNTGLAFSAAQSLTIAPTTLSANGDINLGAAGAGDLVLTGKLIDSGTGNITVSAGGSVLDGAFKLNTGNLSLTSTGGAVTGGRVSPQVTDIDIHAHGNIDFTLAGNGATTLESSNGDIVLDNQFATSPTSLTVNATLGSITSPGQVNLGPNAQLTAGHDIRVRTLRAPTSGSATISAGNDVVIGDATVATQPNFVTSVGNLVVSAGRDVLFDDMAVFNGNFTANAGRDIRFAERFSAGRVAAPVNVELHANGGTLALPQIELVGGLIGSAANQLDVGGQIIVTDAGGVTLTAPVIRLANGISTDAQPITFNGDVVLAPDPALGAITSHGGTYFDGDGDGIIDCALGECFPLDSDLRQIIVRTGVISTIVPVGSPSITLPAGAPVTFNGGITQDPFNGHVALQVISGQASTSFNGAVVAADPSSFSTSSSLQLAVAAGTVNVGAGGSLQADRAFRFSTAVPPRYQFAAAYDGHAIDVLGMTQFASPWPDPAQPFPGSGNGVPIPPGPVNTLMVLPAPITVGNSNPSTGTPSTSSALVVPPGFIGEIPVPADAAVSSTQNLAGATTAVESASNAASAAALQDNGAGPQPGEAAGAPAGGVLFAFSGGRGPAQSADLGRGKQTGVDVATGDAGACEGAGTECP